MALRERRIVSIVFDDATYSDPVYMTYGFRWSSELIGNIAEYILYLYAI